MTKPATAPVAVREFAKSVGYSKMGILHICRRTGIPTERIGRRTYFKRASDAEAIRNALRQLGLIQSHKNMRRALPAAEAAA
jgi:hypothetical protein